MARRSASKKPVRTPPRKGAAPPRKAKGKPGRSRLPALGILLALLTAGAGLVGGVWYATQPRGAHGWETLGGNDGTVRWVTTARGGTIHPPLAPAWVRQLSKLGLPWPSDLPVTPSPASFGDAGAGAAAWFAVRTPRPLKDLWHVQKSSVSLTDAAGHRVPWEGGTGAARGSGRGDTQLLYLRLPPELARAPGTTLRFRLARFDGATTRLVTFHLDD